MWHKQHEIILKGWGESSACYRYLHYKAYQYYRRQSRNYTIPIIGISVLAGAANFMQDAFPDEYRRYIPAGIGTFNLIAAVMTALSQFLKLNELTESHRVSSIHYGKLARSIRVELALPADERNKDGINMVEISRSEYDRLMDQSPSIPKDILNRFEKKFKDKEYNIPDVMFVKPINPYKDPKPAKPAKPTKEPPKPKTTTKKKLPPEKEKAFTNMGLVIRELEELKERNLVTSVKCDLNSCELGLAKYAGKDVNLKDKEDEESDDENVKS